MIKMFLYWDRSSIRSDIWVCLKIVYNHQNSNFSRETANKLSYFGVPYVQTNPIGFWWLKRGSFKILANGTSAMKNGSLIIEQSYFNNER